MKIKMLTLMAGPMGVREAGHVYEVPEDEAQVLIEGNYAEPVKAKGAPAPETEEMSVEGVERAVRPSPRGRKGRHVEQPAEEPAEQPAEAPKEE